MAKAGFCLRSAAGKRSVVVAMRRTWAVELAAPAEEARFWSSL